MKITVELLQEWGACPDGLAYFVEKFPSGAEYANVVAQCDEDNEEDYHRWLFSNSFLHLEATELRQITQAETAQVTTYVQKGLELLDQEIKGMGTASIGREAKLCLSSDHSSLATSGECSRLAATGSVSYLATSGNYSHLATSGNYNRLVASGDNSRLAASGYGNCLATSGRYNRLAASSDHSSLATSGDDSQLVASGDLSHLAASGYNNRLAASGKYSRLSASGYNSRLATSGNYNRLSASGKNSIIASSGLGSTFKLGIGGCAAMPYNDENEKVRFAVAYVGENIKADTWYRVNRRGEFVEVEEFKNERV